VTDDTEEPDYCSETNDSYMEDTATPEYTAAQNGAASNPTYPETDEDTSESTHTDVCIMFLTFFE
jgi:hypothetical protein